MAGTHTYRRGIGPLGLMLSAISAMIGSGFLFSSLYVGRIAGPAAIVAWLAGGILVILVALTYAELTTMLPITGGSTRFPQLTHGTFISLFFGWISWFCLMTAPAIETQALLQYAANNWPELMNKVGNHVTESLSPLGYGVATALMIAFSLINIYSIRLITRLNNFFSFFKIIIPIMTAVVLITVSYHPSNFHNPSIGGFLPTGWKGVFTALATGGILFAFNGFKQAVELAGETKNPSRSVLIGILGSLVIVLIIYLLLQIGFITALPLSSLNDGWSGLHFSGEAGPLAGLLQTVGSNWMAIILYIGALIATCAAGLVFMTSASRLLYGLSANKQLPKFLSQVTTRGIPAYSVLANFIVGMSFFMPFKGWLEMAEFMSSIIALSYVTGPVCCLALRYQLPNHKRSFKLPFVKVWAFIAFYVCTLIVYWTGWHTVKKLGVALTISVALFIVYRIFSKRPRSVHMNWRASIWLWPYLICLTLVSCYGSYGGGSNDITFGWDFVIIAAFSAISLYLSVKYRARDTHVKNTLEKLQAEIDTGTPEDVPDED
jgi:amino acid transporter